MYDHKKIEKKWQVYWEKNQTFHVSDEGHDQKKYYVLDMFPYPSSDGLHVGHPESYTASDIYARYMRMHGAAVLHPVGWDAFGLPAENFAIKKGVHPGETTKKNIANFKRQIQSLGFSYDWSREIDTSSPEYYRWTQWLFLQLYKKGLAVKKNAPVNWCEQCQTVLANEQVMSGACDRCKTSVIQRELSQWFFKVTDYAEELISDLETLDWPESIKQAQIKWIGKSEGATIDFPIQDHDGAVRVFTTRPDTLFGATYLVLAPEHPLLEEGRLAYTNKDEVDMYRKKARGKTERERSALEKEKTGVVLVGVNAINPANGEAIPIWIADYVIASYGTGAIMAVPAHDQRDFEFAGAHHLPGRIVVCPHYPAPTCPVLDEAYEGEGHLVESGSFTGMTSDEAKKKITEYVGGTWTTQYRLRDWLISRQRYWGAPIPILYCNTCGEQPVPEIELPVLLPRDVDFRPTGESPLVRSQSFQNVKCQTCGARALREPDTMDTFVCSSWYFLRYTSPHETARAFIGEHVERWLPVDLYIGGAEHAVLHLLYARFMTKALRDMGYLSFSEPFLRLRNQGMILGEDGEKMSKSRGNVINPDEIVERFGADTMRLYEMFMGPFEDAKPWSTNGIIGVRRFLEKVWRIYTHHTQTEFLEKDEDPHLTKTLHKTIKKVQEDIVSFNFNTAVSALMICANELHRNQNEKQGISRETLETFLLLLSPFAPHIAEELMSVLGGTGELHTHLWPAYDPALIKDESVTLIIQVNGKMRGSVPIPVDLSEQEILSLALADQSIQKWITGKEVEKVIVARGRLANIVLKS